MKDLDQKYRNDNLSIEELSKLRNDFNIGNIEKIENVMREHWMNDEIAIADVDDARINEIKKK